MLISFSVNLQKYIPEVSPPALNSSLYSPAFLNPSKYVLTALP